MIEDRRCVNTILRNETEFIVSSFGATVLENIRRRPIYHILCASFGIFLGTLPNAISYLGTPAFWVGVSIVAVPVVLLAVCMWSDVNEAKPVPNKVLRELAKKYPPAASWYSENITDPKEIH